VKDKQNIIVSGFYGAPNVGDEIICQAVINNLKRVFSDSRIVVITRNISVSSQWISSDAIFIEGFYPSYKFWFNFFKLCRNISRANIVIIGGGGIWQDIFSWVSTTRHLIIGALGLVFGVSVYTIGLGVGPMNRKSLRILTGFLAKNFELLFVRDEHSARQLQNLGVADSKIVVGTDAAPSLFDENNIEGHCKSSLTGAIGISLRKWPDIDFEKVASLFKKLVEEGNKLTLFCCEPEPDKIFYEEVLNHCNEQVRQGCEIFQPSSVIESIEYIRRLDFFIGMRLHVCVLSAAQMVPFIPILYDPKVAGFTAQMDLNSLALSVREVNDDLACKIPEALKYWQNNNDRLKEKFANIVGNSTQMFNDIAGAASHSVRLRCRLVGLLALAALAIIGVFSECCHFFSWFRRRVLLRKTKL
jgi:polysaccharide pyruvyl transferase CsaB